MKKIFKLLILFIAWSAIPSRVSAQEATCFMLDVRGNPLDLSHLCEDSTFDLPSKNSLANDRSGVYIVPIARREGGIPVIKVKFNDRQIFEMLVDTGASITALTKDMAKELQINPEGKLAIQTPSDELTYVPSSYIDSISTAGIVSENVLIIISPSLPIGLLGQNFFGMYDITIKEDVIEFRER
jgi:aspartyl protease family protein